MRGFAKLDDACEGAMVDFWRVICRDAVSRKSSLEYAGGIRAVDQTEPLVIPKPSCRVEENV